MEFLGNPPAIEFRWGRLPDWASDWVDRGVAVLVASGSVPAILAAKAATTHRARARSAACSDVSERDATRLICRLTYTKLVQGRPGGGGQCVGANTPPPGKAPAGGASRQATVSRYVSGTKIPSATVVLKFRDLSKGAVALDDWVPEKKIRRRAALLPGV
jgi:hypothetical protein